MFFQELKTTGIFYLSAISWSFERTWDFAYSKVGWGVPVAVVALAITGALKRRKEGKWDWPVFRTGLIGAIASPLTIFFVGCLINFLYYPVIQDETLSDVQHRLANPPQFRPFNITVGEGWISPRLGYSMDKDQLGRLSGGFFDGKTLHLRPIDWMVYVTLTNNQDIPTQIENYSAFSQSRNDEWVSLCRVPMASNRIYFNERHFQAVDILDNSKSIDVRLAEKTIPPHDSISGWMAFECPDQLCGNTMKLLIKEASEQRCAVT